MILDKTYYKVCYNNSLKSPLFISYTLLEDKVNLLNIKERPYFYDEELVQKEYQTTYYDYMGSGYNRGHLASDASFDWSEESLLSTYSMANITPQNNQLNAGAWAILENYEREQALKYAKVDVKIAVVFDDNPQRIGDSELAVPMGYYKSIANSDESFKECYYYDNIPYDKHDDEMKDHKSDCSVFDGSSF